MVMVMVMMKKKKMIGRRIRGEGDVSEEEGVRPMMKKGRGPPRPALAASLNQVSNDLQSWRGVRCGSTHSSSWAPPVRTCHNHHGYSLQSQLDLQQGTHALCSKSKAQQMSYCQQTMQRHSQFPTENAMLTATRCGQCHRILWNTYSHIQFCIHLLSKVSFGDPKADL